MSVKPPTPVSPPRATAVVQPSRRGNGVQGSREVELCTRRISRQARRLAAVVEAIDKRSDQMHSATVRGISPARAAHAYANAGKPS